MSEDDKNIENFFKNRLESNQFEYQEADWNQLEQRLDAAGIGTQVGSSVGMNIKVITGAIIITLLGFLAGWLIRDQKEDTIEVGNSVSQNMETKESKTNTFFDEDENETILCENEEEECYEESALASVQAPKIKEFKKENLRANTNLIGNTSVNSKSKGMPNSLPKTTFKASTKNTTKISSVINEKSTPTLRLRSANEEGGVNAKKRNAQNSEEAASYQYVHEIHSLRSYLENTSVPTESLLIEADEGFFKTKDTTGVEDVSPLVKSISPDGRLSIGLSLSPDFNGVGFGNKMAASLRPGILIYYRVLPIVTISTGAHFDQKRYESTVDNYDTPPGYWANRTNGILPSLIDGSCRVIDIPLNLHIQFTDLPRINIGGSAGASSYILLDEAYDFEFEQNNPGADTGWSTQEDSEYIAGLVNLSFYVSTRIGRTTELLLEPYFKTPIKDIGWAKVALYGTGVQFTLKYTFKKQNK